MKKLTKFFCMALCFGLALNTFACGGGKDPEEQDSYKQQQVNASLDSVDDFEFTYSQLGGVDEYGNTVPADPEWQLPLWAVARGNGIKQYPPNKWHG